MNEKELIEWGRGEDALRKADLASINSQAGLTVAQTRAKQRRNLVGLTAGQAADAVHMAQREGGK